MNKMAIIMGTCKTEPQWGYTHALSVSAGGSTGFFVGGYVRTKIRDQEYMCEITKISETQVELVGIGWVDRQNCYL